MTVQSGGRSKQPCPDWGTDSDETSVRQSKVTVSMLKRFSSSALPGRDGGTALAVATWLRVPGALDASLDRRLTESSRQAALPTRHERSRVGSTECADTGVNGSSAKTRALWG